MLLSELPPEIADAIMDHLANDRKALLACAVIGRDWIPRSRFYLFSELPILLKPDYVFSLIDLLDPAPSSHSPHAGPPVPSTIAPFVRRLIFDGLSSFLFHNGADAMSHAIRGIQRLLSHLPAARIVRLSNFDMTNLPPDITGPLFASFNGNTSTLRGRRSAEPAAQGITDLELHAIHFHRFFDFASMICDGFARLRALSLKWVAWTYAGVPLRRFPYLSFPASNQSSRSSGYPNLEIHISTLAPAHASDLADWLNAHPTPSRCALKSLVYHGPGATSSGGPKTPTSAPSLGGGTVQTLVRRSVHSLERLEIYFPIFGGIDEARVVLSPGAFIDLALPPASNLKRALCVLHLRQILLWPNDPLSILIRPWVGSILEQASSSAVAPVTLSNGIAPPANSTEPQPTNLQELLLSFTFDPSTDSIVLLDSDLFDWGSLRKAIGSVSRSEKNDKLETMADGNKYDHDNSSSNPQWRRALRRLHVRIVLGPGFSGDDTLAAEVVRRKIGMVPWDVEVGVENEISGRVGP